MASSSSSILCRITSSSLASSSLRIRSLSSRMARSFAFSASFLNFSPEILAVSFVLSSFLPPYVLIINPLEDRPSGVMRTSGVSQSASGCSCSSGIGFLSLGSGGVCPEGLSYLVRGQGHRLGPDRSEHLGAYACSFQSGFFHRPPGWRSGARPKGLSSRPQPAQNPGFDWPRSPLLCFSKPFLPRGMVVVVRTRVIGQHVWHV